MDTKTPFATHRDAALALLTHGRHVSRKAGGFLGQLCTDPAPLSDKQQTWLASLLKQDDMPPFIG